MTALTPSSSAHMFVVIVRRPPRSTPASPVITATASCDTPSTKHSRHRPVRPIKEVPRDDEPDDEHRGLPLAPAQGDERPRTPQHHRSDAPSGRSPRVADLDAGLPYRHRRARPATHTPPGSIGREP